MTIPKAQKKTDDARDDDDDDDEEEESNRGGGEEVVVVERGVRGEDGGEAMESSPPLRGHVLSLRLRLRPIIGR